MKRIVLFYCSALILFLLTPPTYAQQAKPIFRRFTLDQGLSMNFINCITQDKKGFIWVGTRDGLNKYDGYKFTVYRSDSKLKGSLSNSSIASLAEDKEGVLYVGTDNGGLNVYDRAGDSFTSYMHDPKNPQSIAGNRVTAIFEDAQGVLWVGTENGLNTFDRKAKTFTRYIHNSNSSQSVISNVIRAMTEDQQGNLWIGTEEGTTVLDKTRKKFTHYLHDPANPTSISTNPVRSLFVDRDNLVWIGTAFGGLNRFDEKTHAFTHYRQGDAAAQRILGDYVPGLCEDNQGNIWAATNFGVTVINKKNNTSTHYQTDRFDQNSLVDNGLNTVYHDSMDNVWVGSIAGLSMKESLPAKFHHYVNNPGSETSLGTKEVFCFYQGSNGDILIGAREGFDQFDRSTNTFKHNKLYANGKTLPTILSMYEDQHHIFWLGMYEGLLRQDRAKGTEEFFSKAIPGDNTSSDILDVWYLQEDAEGTLWIASFTRGVMRYNREKNQFEPLRWEGKNVPTVGIESFLVDKAGNLWIGTETEGLFKINRKKNIFQTYKHDEANSKSLSDNFVLSLFEDKRGNFWVGTKDGLNQMNQATGTFVSYLESDGLPNNVINSIQEDNNGTLWLSTNKGLSNFNPTAKKFKNYNIDDGLQHNEFWHRSSCKLKSGELLFGGLNGFNVFDPSTIRDNTYIPQVFVTDFQIFNKPVAIGEDSPLQQHISETKELVLSYKESVFSFEFVALNYIISKNNQYAYKMEGFDTDWNMVGTQRKATYTNLDPGEYTFRVKASNNDGVWNDQGTAIRISITPPFWQTWWFKALIAIVIIGSAITFFRVRMRVVKAQKEELERQVQERTAEVMHQKEELQTQSDHLLLVNGELQEKQEEILQQQEELQATADQLQTSNDELQVTQEQLMQQREEIELQRDSLQKVNEHVMSSIQYAKTIQQAILPSAKKIQSAFQDHFILYRPKDVVSGDFYWFAHLSKEDSGALVDYSFLAVVDCTGHGVPGAFMSIIGNTLLNEIVNQKRILDPAKILEQLNIGVKLALDKAEGVNTAGMDVCLCRFERGEGNQVSVQFSGAKRSLYYVQQAGELQKLEADRKSIGSESQVQRQFTTQELHLLAGDTLYLTSDGYADQNNPQREKFGSQRFKNVLTKAVNLPMSEQKLRFEQALDAHCQGAEQRDDITLVAVQV